MKTIGINGSPRKGWNTSILVEEALRGAASGGSETELINLYDLNFKGCVSCFSCKLKGGKSLGRCAAGDDLKPVLDRVHECDALVVGSPVYLSEVSAGTRAFFERLIFQYLTYGNKERKTFFDRRIPVVLIYTMNIGGSLLDGAGYTAKFKAYEDNFDRYLGPAQTLVCTETWQTTDYGRYEMTMFNGEERKKRRDEVFPEDKRKAFDLGAGLFSRQTP
jgi:multimeric flavodoxin WrbA